MFEDFMFKPTTTPSFLIDLDPQQELDNENSADDTPVKVSSNVVNVSNKGEDKGDTSSRGVSSPLSLDKEIESVAICGSSELVEVTIQPSSIVQRVVQKRRKFVSSKSKPVIASIPEDMVVEVPIVCSNNPESSKVPSHCGSRLGVWQVGLVTDGVHRALARSRGQADGRRQRAGSSVACGRRRPTPARTETQAAGAGRRCSRAGDRDAGVRCTFLKRASMGRTCSRAANRSVKVTGGGARRVNGPGAVRVLAVVTRTGREQLLVVARGGGVVAPLVVNDGGRCTRVADSYTIKRLE
ncbi:Glycerol-3-phosphate dehydrogenase [NAD(P)+] [Striga asiatica]|uniref:Glycerol-3-phosphate dehydrogenase [NAD(P)+] n=1 Tax=Striga asiatica TaxID=4170 RepID=A0A5A7QGN3_STRAF|nr:Glycerol-3-phosphate dehydrogenase [NAD(P)+] [Striga asiatica]